ncbi:MAG: DUF4271 domain-containing protein [Bacteroidia bacterium]|nr:DUF4271 domain-containing protein [Bacteroidia bacterium]MBT8277450.1 DUF4271 domain-containing protein [Bacteroidia bacterium]NND24491.1 DUF4271 domain-containing protein [Flavobacteriaceae bacterium]NNK60788.1 DUF4271 domain-containing protein [Flavobacteriaceae bacterium]NNL32838.1 DUF4271 domain-containing protein [Flavobacteriaceae bacterium]
MLRNIISNEWFTILIVLCLIIIAFTKLSFSRRFNDFVTVVGNSNYLKIYRRDQKFIDQFDGLLFLNLVISASIFVFLAFTTLIDPIEFDIFLFIKILVAIGAIILIKVLLERLIGSLFDIDDLMDSYIFQKTNYRNFTGLFLLPINILLIYSFEPTSVIIYVVMAFIVLIHLIGFLTTFKSYQNVIIENLFYFILYLCALEFGPYILLYKVFN